jgi:hypothetical protein
MCGACRVLVPNAIDPRYLSNAPRTDTPMPVTNRPADNDPDLSRTSPRSVEDARVVLMLREHYQRGIVRGFQVGFMFAAVVVVILRFLFFR